MNSLRKLISEKKDWLGLLFIPVIWLIYARFAPGGEFFGVYRQIVLNPESYQTNSAIFNPPWVFPILAPWITMPGRSGFVFYLFIILLSSLFATKILKGNFLFVLLSAQLFWILWWGQVDWIVFFGIGLCWYAYKKESWWLIGIAILLVSIKPHLGLFGVLYLWYISKGRLKSAALVIIFFVMSLFIWGQWPVWIVDHAIHMVADPAHQMWNMSLGIWASPILLLVILVKKSPDKKFLAFVAATMLISPYMPYYSSIVLLGFNLPVWMFVFAFIGYLPKLISPALAWQGLFLFPVSVIIWIYWPEIIHFWFWMKTALNQKKTKTTNGINKNGMLD